VFQGLFLGVALLVVLKIRMLALSRIFHAAVLCFHALIKYTRRHSTGGGLSLMNGLLLLM
jgi:hypothetical protein